MTSGDRGEINLSSPQTKIYSLAAARKLKYYYKIVSFCP
jgi:hypothetical protein